jgi:hypothetical protein
VQIAARFAAVNPVYDFIGRRPDHYASFSGVKMAWRVIFDDLAK